MRNRSEQELAGYRDAQDYLFQDDWRPLGGRLIGMSEERAKDPVAPVGPLLENFAIGEVARQLTWAKSPCSFSITVTAIWWRLTWFWCSTPENNSSPSATG